MGKYSILIVDDEENVQKSLKRVFFNDGYNIYTANNAEEALRILQREDIDLIICDHKMPGLTGLEFLERTVHTYPDLIRIILTGHADMEDTLRAINKGNLYKFILKPWNNDDLRVTVKRALELRDIIIKNKKLNQEIKMKEKTLKEIEKKYPNVIKKL